jgi:hypothetical protein
MQLIVIIDLPGETKRPPDSVLAARLHEVAERISDGVAAGDFRDQAGWPAGQFDVQTRE